MKINKNERYDNLMIGELCDLYNTINKTNIKKDLNCKEVNEILKNVREYFKDKDLKTNIDINYREKFCCLNKFRKNAQLEIYKHYINKNIETVEENDLFFDIQSLCESFLVRKVREKYPKLMRKYQELFNERRDYIYEENTTLEFPIEVVFEMIEQEEMNFDLYKTFGYIFEGMRFAESTINKYFELESKQ